MTQIHHARQFQSMLLHDRMYISLIAMHRELSEIMTTATTARVSLAELGRLWMNVLYYAHARTRNGITMAVLRKQ